MAAESGLAVAERSTAESAGVSFASLTDCWLLDGESSLEDLSVWLLKLGFASLESLFAFGSFDFFLAFDSSFAALRSSLVGLPVGSCFGLSVSAAAFD